MGYRLREFDAESKFISELTMEAIGQVVPLTEIKAVTQILRKDPGVSNGYCSLCIVVLLFHEVGTKMDCLRTLSWQ